MVSVSGSRNKKMMYKGIVNNAYQNVFTVLVEGIPQIEWLKQQKFIVSQL